MERAELARCLRTGGERHLLSDTPPGVPAVIAECDPGRFLPVFAAAAAGCLAFAVMAFFMRPRAAQAPPPDHSARGMFAGVSLMGGIAIGPVVLHGSRRTGVKLLADDVDVELARLTEASEKMQRGLDDLISGGSTGTRVANHQESREILEAYRLVAADAGWLRRDQRRI